MMYGPLNEMCDYCWRPAIARIVKHHNTIIRTLLGMPRPKASVCRDHLYVRARKWPK